MTGEGLGDLKFDDQKFIDSGGELFLDVGMLVHAFTVFFFGRADSAVFLLGTDRGAILDNKGGGRGSV